VTTVLRPLAGETIVDVGARLTEELVTFTAPDSAPADQYRILRQEVERLARDSGARVFAVTSAGPGEGKTVTTLNLAGSLAQAQPANVLVVEADLRRPSVAKYLGITSEGPGLAEAIRQDQFDLARAVRRLDWLGISMLPTGAAKRAPYELLASPRFAMVLAEMRRRYNYVLIDTPPVLPVADSRLPGPLVDGFIVVVSAHKTPRKALAETLRLLSPAKVFGVVFNGDDRPVDSYHRYYGYSTDAAARKNNARDTR
jgi:protein-tyrosine kinase